MFLLRTGVLTRAGNAAMLNPVRHGCLHGSATSSIWARPLESVMKMQPTASYILSAIDAGRPADRSVTF